MSLAPLAVALATALATAWLARRASAWGLADDPLSSGPADRDAAARKLQRAPVPAVGGLALGAALAGYVAVAGTPGAVHPVGFGLACLFGLALGVSDDREPLRPARKLAGQLVAAAPLAASAALAGADAFELLGTVLVVLVAVNACNTFDNADGALGSVGMLAGLAAWPPLAWALLGFLPFNFGLGAAFRSDAEGYRAGGPASEPRAYLGDAGSHLIGVICAALPAAWPLLLLPVLDLARVALERLGAGVEPWRGDRRHLAHRLDRAGLGPPAVAATLAAIAAPCLFAGPSFAPAARIAGPLATVLLFAVAVALTRDQKVRTG